MAKSKKKDKKSGGAQAEAVDSIRAAIERGLQVSAEGAQATRERTRELVDEIASAAGRVRQSLEDMRVLDELRRLRTEVEALAARVAALERPGSSASTTAAAKPAAAKPATAKPATAKPAAARPRAKTTSTRTRKPATRKKTTSSSSTTAAKKPAARTRSRAKKSTGTS